MCLAVPSKVIALEGDDGKVEVGGVVKNISLMLLQNVEPGDYVLVHAGYAIERIDQQEALETLGMFERLLELERQDRSRAAGLS